MATLIEIELVFASAKRQVLLPIQVTEGATVADVISQSDIHLEFPEEQIHELEVGVWGRPVGRDSVVRDGDRVEIYRPLQIDPRDARRHLALAGRTMGMPPDS